jgi:hypothetical protein
MRIKAAFAVALKGETYNSLKTPEALYAFGSAIWCYSAI